MCKNIIRDLKKKSVFLLNLQKKKEEERKERKFLYYVRRKSTILSLQKEFGEGVPGTTT